jgi:hypothetical protein
LTRAAVFSSQAFVTEGLREANRTVMTHHMTDDAYGSVARPRRRFGLFAGLAAVLLLVGYWLSPYVAATRFALAVQSGDSVGAIARMDVVGLRNSFARQIVQAYLARNPQLRNLDPLKRQVIGGVATGYVAAIVADYLTPEALAELLAQGRTGSAAGALVGDSAAFPPIDGIGRAFGLFMASGFTGLDSFAVQPEMTGYKLNFGLRGGRWLLRSVLLPEAMINRLADELTTRTATKP